MATINGTDNGETLNGTPGDDTINGLGGDDTLNGNDGNDTLNGGNGNDTLNGGSGNDTLDGGPGNDIMNGGTGDDIYFVDSASDVVNEFAGEGTDEIRTNLSAFSLAALPNVENLTGLGTNQTLTGNALANVITAGAGADVLDGGAGADTMIGGLGNDDYTVDDAGDTIVESAGGGTDIVHTSLASFSIAPFAEVENLTGTSNAGQSLTGNGLNNVIVGANGADTLDGGAGDDRLDGGQGADTMIGGAGDDTFIVDNSGDVVVEAANGGNDIVFASAASYTLGANVERLTGTSSSGQTLTGNDQDNVIIGGSGADILNGGGGNDTLTAGAGDTLAGGTGDDTYILPPLLPNVTIVENPGEGIDTIIVSRGFDLRTTPNVENLTYTGGDGSEPATLIGNALDNVITGANIKFGETIDGGLGADTMIGLGGPDTYYVDNPGDVVVEAASGSGIDLVNTTISYTLAANVENLTATSNAGLSLTGNDGNNVITGAAGNDTLDGGLGTDALRGNGGSDIFAFSSVLGGSNVDTIVDFSNGVDKIGLDDDTFIGVTSGNLANVFVNGTMAQDADDRIIYDSATGQLFYDPDGNSPQAQVLFAVVNGAPQLSALDFMVLTDPPGQHLTGTPGNDVLIGGAGDDTIDGLGGNDVLDGRQGSDTMNGGAGDDQYFVDSAGDVVNEAPNEGFDIVYSAVSYTLAAGSAVEELGTTDETSFAAINLTGNELDNYVTGNAGNNILDGGSGGVDQLWGRGGDDTYYVDSGDTVVEYAGQGQDTVYARSSFVLSPGMEVEVLATADPQATTPINLTGNELHNYITGNAGANTLDGGGGSDTLSGGAGDDSYFANSDDVVIENAGQGYDILYASSDYSLAAGVSIEVLGTVDNFATTPINLTGNELDNYITGNAGNNILDGGGGSDTLWGREGDDSYFVDSNDVVTEYAGQGYDTVYARSDYTLGAGVSVEVLATADNSATTPINLTGNELDNYVTGNAGNNILDGGGGSDILWGRGGDDSYFVDSNDVVTEYAGQGYDTVYARSDYTLGAGVSVEVLATVDNFATTPINLTGNELDNYITGNAGNNVLDGGNGGSDTLWGREGNDSYFVDSNDVVTEYAGQGFDIVYARSDYTLGAGVSVEELGTADNFATTAINLTGNDLVNYVTGNAGANTIDGGGGSDTLEGRGGADSFAFTTPLGPDNVDTILGFGNGADQILLDHSVFSGLGLGTLSADAFRTGAVAQDADDRILYDTSTGALYFDPDGSGSAAAVQFAVLAGAPPLTANAFTVI